MSEDGERGKPAFYGILVYLSGNLLACDPNTADECLCVLRQGEGLLWSGIPSREESNTTSCFML